MGAVEHNGAQDVLNRRKKKIPAVQNEIRISFEEGPDDTLNLPRCCHEVGRVSETTIRFVSG